MVKVKESHQHNLWWSSMVSTTLWWKLKKRCIDPVIKYCQVSTTLWWKLKTLSPLSVDLKYSCFNHPMVKVKVYNVKHKAWKERGFNHPMVKVKVYMTIVSNAFSLVSTTLWWKLKYRPRQGNKALLVVSTTLWWKLKPRKELSCERNVSFNHPMVKVKEKPNCTRNYSWEGFNHPMVKVKADLLFTSESRNKVSTTLWWKLKPGVGWD